jgi:hypothetical protein
MWPDRPLIYFLNEQGEPEPLNMAEFDRDPELQRRLSLLDPEYAQRRRVALDEVGGYRVSTVFLGVDHNFAMHGPPVLWETMVFDDSGQGRPWDEWQDRYTSRADAEAGHRRVVDAINRGESPPD